MAENIVADLDRDMARLALLVAINRHIPKRPRTHHDRRWLDGYCEACVTIRNVSGLQTEIARQSVAREMIRSFRSSAFSKVAPQFNHLSDNGYLKLSSAQKGHCDAWLDSVGC